MRARLKHARRRRGYSLIEALVVMAVGTALLAMAMSVLYLLKEAQVQARQGLVEGRTVVRLADQFRDDAGAAVTMQLLPGQGAAQGDTVWRLKTPRGEDIQYEVTGDSVNRLKTMDDKTMRETFRLPSGMRARIDSPQPGQPWATLRLEAVDPRASAQRPVVIEAVLGLDGRHDVPHEPRETEAGQ